MYSPDIKQLTNRVIQYNSMIERNPKSAGISSLRNLIINDIWVIIYSMHNDIRLLDEEDAGEFLLYMDSKLESIIRNYNDRGPDFKKYLYPILIRKLKSFYKCKAIKSKHERTIAHCHTKYEYELDEEENYTYYIAEKRELNIFQTNELHKLKYICRNSRTANKRLFIYIMHLASNLQQYDLSTLCEVLCFDKEETIKIIDKISILNPENNRTMLLKERRNINWARQLFLQEDLSAMNYLSDYSMNDIYQNRIDHYMDCYNNQTKKLAERKKSVSRTVIANLLGISIANAGAAVYYTKNVLKYCMGEPQSAQSMGISDHLFKILESDVWHYDTVPFAEKIFIPSKNFHFSSDLQIQEQTFPQIFPQVEFKEQINYPHFIQI